MKAEAHRQTMEDDALARERRFNPHKIGAIAADDEMLRVVDADEIAELAQRVAASINRGRAEHREHEAGLARARHRSGLIDEPRDDLLRRCDLRERGRDEIAEARAEHDVRLRAARLQRSRERVLHREQRRMRDVRVVERLARARVAAIQTRDERRPRLVARHFVEPVDVMTERRLGLVQRAPHSDVLAALPRKHPDDSGRAECIAPHR